MQGWKSPREDKILRATTQSRGAATIKALHASDEPVCTHNSSPGLESQTPSDILEREMTYAAVCPKEMIRTIMKHKSSLRGSTSSLSSPLSLDNKQSPNMFLQNSEQGAVTTSREEIDGFPVSRSSSCSRKPESTKEQHEGSLASECSISLLSEGQSKGKDTSPDVAAGVGVLNDRQDGIWPHGGQETLISKKKGTEAKGGIIGALRRAQLTVENETRNVEMPLEKYGLEQNLDGETKGCLLKAAEGTPVRYEHGEGGEEKCDPSNKSSRQEFDRDGYDMKVQSARSAMTGLDEHTHKVDEKRISTRSSVSFRDEKVGLLLASHRSYSAHTANPS